MSEWLNYELQDFLLFSETAYWRLFERLNAAFWPFQAVLVAVFAATLSASLVWKCASRFLIGLLVCSWCGVALGFAPIYAEINWMMDYIAPVFWTLAIALGAFAVVAPTRSFASDRRRGDLRSRLGAAIAAAGLFLWPLAAILFRGSHASAEIIGLAPDPTAVATLGFLMALGRGWSRALLCLPPLLWCAFSALTLVTMGASIEGFMLAAIPVAALIAFVRDLVLRLRSQR